MPEPLFLVWLLLLPSQMQLPAPLDLSLHDTLEFRVRSRDGHTYVASLRADQYTGGDEEAWQAPLRPKG
jgi:hypothetical protein